MSPRLREDVAKLLEASDGIAATTTELVGVVEAAAALRAEKVVPARTRWRRRWSVFPP
jgi:hypothetical protein